MRLPALIALVLVAGCSTTDPQNGASISYRLPRTDAKVLLALDVVECSPEVKIESTLTMSAIAGARDEVLYVTGADLASSSTKRSLTIAIDDNGVISSVNSTATDQRSVILGNIVKIAASAAQFAGGEGDVPVLKCTQRTQDELALATASAATLATARGALSTSTDPEGDQKKVNAVASILAAAKASLHADVAGSVKIEAGLSGQENAQPVKFDWTPVARLLETAYVGPDATPPKPGISPDAEVAFLVKAHTIELGQPRTALGGEPGKAPKPCRQWLTVPASRYVKVVLDRQGQIVKGTDSTPLEQVMPVSQLNTDAQVCLSTAFGENRTLGLKFDKFGRTTEFAWSADARAANVSSTLAGIAPDAAGIANTLRGSDLAADKRELDELTTSQSLQKARACQALLDAGADKCP